jgi:endo-1,4-beta-xylanase
VTYSWSQATNANGAYTLGWTDKEVRIAAQDRMTLTMPLIWGGELPDWLTQGNYTQDQLSDFAPSFITTTVDRYKGQVQVWQVVNEPVWETFSGDPSVQFWQNSFGSNYDAFVLNCFKWARQADPNGTLLLTDFTNDGQQPGVAEGFLQLVQYLQANGAPIDGVGIEGHIFYQYNNPTVQPDFSPTVFGQWITKYKALGLKVYITEFDVDMTGFAGSREQEEAYQAQWYHDFLAASLKAGVVSFTIYGLTDDTSWYNDPNFPDTYRPNADALIMNSDFSAKPSYFAVQQALEERLQR